ncbi:MAG: DNA recombination protein RmuC [Bryobacterales bacterium]|nr:DNA recombination protein RmuC [Bryobacterales bacterium]
MAIGYAAAFLGGLALGAVLAFLWMRARVVAVESAKNAAEAAMAGMGATFQSMADAALRSSHQAFLQSARATLETVRAEMTGDLAQKEAAIDLLVRPLQESLRRLDGQVREMESARQHVFGSLEQQMRDLGATHGRLQKETAALVSALRAPNVRGRWGEITLRRVAELAGMAGQCDFFEQETHGNDGARIRPDMIVRLPGGRTVVVDAKVPLAGYLDAVAADDESQRRAALARHCQQVTRHLDQLSGKSYWSQFQPAPEFVVLFLPGDHFLSAALELNRDLLEDAVARRVLIATPTTLIAILKGVAYGWQQEQLAENAEQIRRESSELYERFQTVHEHFSQVGAALARAVDAYNRCVGSIDARLLPSLRRVRELGITAGEEPALPGRVDVSPRNSSGPEAAGPERD